MLSFTAGYLAVQQINPSQPKLVTYGEREDFSTAREEDICRTLEDTVGGGGVTQAYSRLSTTRGHITDCKLDSLVYAGVCVVF